MFTSVRQRFGAAIAAAILLVTTAVHAATANLSLDTYNRGQISGARSAMSDHLASCRNLHIDTFEPAKAGTHGALETGVGRFAPTGAAAVALLLTGGTGLAGMARLRRRARPAAPPAA